MKFGPIQGCSDTLPFFIEVPNEQVEAWRAEGKTWSEIGKILGEQLNRRMDDEISAFYAAIRRHAELKEQL